MRRIQKAVVHVLLLLLFAAPAVVSAAPVVVIGFDGISARATKAAASFAPFETVSSYTYNAITVVESRSEEAWASIFMSGDVMGRERTPLFTYLKSQDPTLELWLIADYTGIHESVGGSSADKVAVVSGATAVNTLYRQWLAAAVVQPDLVVLYSQDADSAGHAHGWESETYNASVLNNGLAAWDLYSTNPDATYFIVSDHGGIGKSHSFSTHQSIRNPFYREVPFFQFPVDTPGPICRQVLRTDDYLSIIIPHVGTPLFRDWRTFAGDDVPGCSEATVQPSTSDASTIAALPALAVAIELFAIWWGAYGQC